MFGSALVEVIAPDADVVACVLVDAAGKPLAVAQGAIVNGAGSAIASELERVAPDQIRDSQSRLPVIPCH